MKYLETTYKFLGKIIIKLILVVGLLGVPLTCLIFKLKHPNVTQGWILLVFLCLLMIERAWETFYSTGESKKHKLYGDWTLPVVSIAYLLMLFGLIWEFFSYKERVSISITLFGLTMFILSFLIRLWGIQTLKEQWAVHAVGAKKIKDAFLVKSGPYKHIRHPIYLGVILEVMSIPIIWNTYYALAFAIAVNVPLQLMRAQYEERATIRKLGNDYIEYKKTVPAILPLRFKKTK